LANFAGGVLVLIFKPYGIGDLIESQGQLGVVKSIQIFNTILLSPENKTIILPNGAVMNSHITNYTTEGKLRVDMNIGVSYSADLKKAKDIILGVINEDSRVLKDPAPLVAVSELGDSAVNIIVRPWTLTADYWSTRFDLIEKCKVALDQNGISIPFPQRDIHLFNHNS
jgi:small conductance mechanosensitive channel